MNSSKKKYALWALIVIVVVALGAAIYMYWYVPRTPVYTLNIIRTAVDNHDANTIFKHIDTKSIVGKTVDREIEKSTGSDKDDVKHFAPLIKTVAVAAVNNLIINRVQNADTRRTIDLIPVQPERNIELCLNPFGDPRDLFVDMRAFDEDRKFVSAESGNEIGRPETFA